MSVVDPRLSQATARRVLRQLRHDPRTVALLLVVPSVLLALLSAVLSQRRATFDLVGPPLVGIFPLISMFLVTSVAMLRERTSGTLERLLTMPIAKLDLLVGYGAAFSLVAVVQAGVVGGVGFGLLGLVAPHGVAPVVALAIANGLVGTCLGLLLSAFARTEFQAVQFLPAFVFPQLLLCGLIVPRHQMAWGLQAVARLLPLTYSYDALAKTARPGPLGPGEVADVAVLAAIIVTSLALGAATLRRRTD
jgi:ABC-2 type transport system permease protein